MNKLQRFSGNDLLQNRVPVLIEHMDLNCFRDFSSVDKIINSLRNKDVHVLMKVIGPENVSRAYKIPHIGQTKTYADLITRKGSKFIFYISKIERAHPCISEFRKKIAKDNEFRKLDSVLSISFPVSAGFQRPHFDTFNAIIVQLSGKRSWTIWDKERRDEFFCISDDTHEVNYVNEAQLPGSPLLQIELCPGQCLYIPATYPHFGVAAPGGNDAAISFAISWDSK